MYQFISSSKKGRNCFDRHLTMEETGPEKLSSFLKVTLGTAAGIFFLLAPHYGAAREVATERGY